ncbi:MAG: GNAT family N-acetyltransferase [Actinobacteria bacterium]|nr:GNAT family N-acetyltransferase [Actinomycetota bacterium]
MLAGHSALASAAVAGSDWTVRAASEADAAGILEIYNHAVTATVDTFDLVPRTLEQQAAWIRDHAGGHPAVVAVDGSGTVLGFGSLSQYRPRPAYATTVEDSVYVAESARGAGIGKAVLADLVRRAREHGFHSVIGRIVGHNEVSIGLHRACGFVEVGTEQEVGRKFNRWLDVVVMQLLL